MIGTLIGLIFALIIIGVVWWAAQQLLALVPMPEPIRKIVYVLMILIIVIIVLWILVAILGLAGVHVNTFGLGR